MCRCFDVDPRNLGKDDNIRPVVIIPGPKQPSNLGPYLLPMLEEFKKHGDCTEKDEVGVKVKDAKGNEILHRPYVAGRRPLS